MHGHAHILRCLYAFSVFFSFPACCLCLVTPLFARTCLPPPPPKHAATTQPYMCCLCLLPISKPLRRAFDSVPLPLISTLSWHLLSLSSLLVPFSGMPSWMDSNSSVFCATFPPCPTFPALPSQHVSVTLTLTHTCPQIYHHTHTPSAHCTLAFFIFFLFQTFFILFCIFACMLLGQALLFAF